MQVTKNKTNNVVITTAVILLGSLGGEMVTTNQAQAIGVTRSAVSVSGEIGERNNSSLAFDNLINQSSLSSNYVNGVTDFDSYTSTTTANSRASGSNWQSAQGITTGFLSFDLGDTYKIDGIALWNRGGNNTRNIIDFELYADDDADSSNGLGTFLGSFTADPNLGSQAAVFADSFARLQFRNAINYGLPFVTSKDIARGSPILSTSANGATDIKEQ